MKEKVKEAPRPPWPFRKNIMLPLITNNCKTASFFNRFYGSFESFAYTASPPIGYVYFFLEKKLLGCYKHPHFIT